MSSNLSDRAILVMLCIGLTLAPLSGLAEEFTYYDEFSDGELDATVEIVGPDAWFEVNPDGFTLYSPTGTDQFHLTAVNGERIQFRSGWSFRTRVTLEILQGDNIFFAVGTSIYHHAGVRETEDGDSSLRVGIRNGKDNDVIETSVSYPYLGEEILVQFDGYGDDLRASVWKPGKPDSLVQQTHMFPMTETQPAIALGRGSATIHELWIRSSPMPIFPGDFNSDRVLDAQDIDRLTANLGELDLWFDVNYDNTVDLADHRMWVKDLKGTWFGDANLDGEFNSGDLVDVFAAGKYVVDPDTAETATWAEGDWNGDMLFDSGDLVLAFEDGGYEQGPLVPKAVPEPTGIGVMTISLALLTVSTRRRRRRC